MTREKALRRQIQRLADKEAAQEVFNRRFTLARIVIFLLGVVSTGFAAIQLDSTTAWLVFFIALVVFLVTVLFHRKVLKWIEMLRIMQAILGSQIARMELDWESIPYPSAHFGQNRTSLEIDLDLTGQRSIHHLLDNCISIQGSQLLANWLKESNPDPEQSRARQAVVRELIPMTNLRNRFLLTFSLASKENLRGDLLLNWLAEDLPSKNLAWKLAAAAGLVILNLILFTLFATANLPAYWIVTFGIYLGFYYFNIRNLLSFLQAVIDLDSELDKFWPVLHFLETTPFAKKPHLTELLKPVRSAKQSPSERLRKLKWVTAGVGIRSNPIISILLNVIFPWDFLFAYLAMQARQGVASDLPAWLELLYQFDAHVSLANFGYINPEYTFPEIQADAAPIFQASGLSHPLLPPHKKISNDFCIDSLGEIFVITGSNMAGKSTFVKAIGLNLCLAYAGSPVSAKHLRTLPMRLHTCIKISDSITDGFSYFYAEVKCLKHLSDKIQSPGWPVLYLIDEIFRGTNNRERLIGSRAYLRSLAGTQAVGFLATHDIELATLENEDPLIKNYHFRDKVESGRLTFDYHLYPGPSPTTNALIIMELEGLPIEKPDSSSR